MSIENEEEMKPEGESTAEETTVPSKEEAETSIPEKTDEETNSDSEVL